MTFKTLDPTGEAWDIATSEAARKAAVRRDLHEILSIIKEELCGPFEGRITGLFVSFAPSNGGWKR